MSDATVTVIASMKVKPGTEDEARAALQSAVAPTRSEPGCLAYDLHQSMNDPTEFLFYERWVNQGALDAHAASTAPHRAVLRQQLGQLLDGRPSLTIWKRVA
jgi:quinol monooxygenase YgiN